MGKKRFATQTRGVSGIPLVAWLLIGAAVGLAAGYIFMGGWPVGVGAAGGEPRRMAGPLPALTLPGPR